jgi:hypothetical protein
MSLAHRYEAMNHRAFLVAAEIIEDVPNDSLAAQRMAIAAEVSEAAKLMSFSGNRTAELVLQVELELELIHAFARGWRRKSTSQNEPSS